VLREYYRQMALIRSFELRAAEMYTRAKIGGYCHLNLGEEATVVGLMAALRAEDYLFTSYRGRVRAGLPRRPGPDSLAVMCQLGDATTTIGAFHESLNLAALWRLPIVYVIVNNQLGMGTPVEAAAAEPELWKRGCSYRIPGSGWTATTCSRSATPPRWPAPTAGFPATRWRRRTARPGREGGGTHGPTRTHTEGTAEVAVISYRQAVHDTLRAEWSESRRALRAAAAALGRRMQPQPSGKAFTQLSIVKIERISYTGIRKEVPDDRRV
jgi:hypothetical protein